MIIEIKDMITITIVVDKEIIIEVEEVIIIEEEIIIEIEEVIIIDEEINMKMGMGIIILVEINMEIVIGILIETIVIEIGIRIKEIEDIKVIINLI